MTAATANNLEQMVTLARSRAGESRRLLLENMTDLFLSPEGRLSERERSLMTEIIAKLLHEMEMEVRRNLAERLSATESAPRELMLALANDEIAIARPVLQRSRLLHDEDLIEVVRHRSQEHRLAVAMRTGLSSLVSQYLVDCGDELVIEALLQNHDATLSRHAIEYLAEESKRIDRFQEPLLRRPDLPPGLAHRMFWWVSAGLRQAILTRYDLDPQMLDQMLEAASAAAAGSTHQNEVDKLIRRLTERGELSERFVLQNLRNGHVTAAIAALAAMSGLDLATTRRVVLDQGGEALAACCKAAGFSRGGFASTFLLTREAHERGAVTDPGKVEEIVRLFDRMEPRLARAALRFWMRDNGYQAAVERLTVVAGTQPKSF